MIGNLTGGWGSTLSRQAPCRRWSAAAQQCGDLAHAQPVLRGEQQEFLVAGGEVVERGGDVELFGFKAGSGVVAVGGSRWASWL
ncbi:hypothetical protein LX15_005038 [Streptoalloteichus tenebrarius]|uniref:Uncharacterized protein n=1 Tax=Streptoalloteichus tenebrarius (strain ATCC 17920 / DSM 40477 / JCM 4838 / CBS 697.72 / NBRC 16177 / NCIMB 11028 / NRRL B-12390 / A12253. 1 / ISP 5477) TaxID=1933 RepID=A0ABT1I0L5_STRSD|nr:hypothetical protein [Streptoalloteichus tenebrarius]MCP2261317.1 hypothetical protein [Streptoalloteichus tenebrarius]BFF03715.1 hypothetical protein GCM10020241_53900 [Streptoalloteichus tenebrarius]